MISHPPSGFGPMRAWFYVLLGLVVVESTLLCFSGIRVPASKAAAVPAAAPAPRVVPWAAPDPSPPPPVAVVKSDQESTEPGRDPLTRALRTQGRLRRAHRFEDLGASLAAANSGEAVQTLGGLAAADRLPFVRGMFDTLARGDRAAALTAAQRLTAPDDKEAALTTLLAVWNGDGGAGLDRSRATNIARYGLEAGLGMELFDQTGPDLALQWAQALPADTGRAALLGSLAARLVLTDPARALSLGAGLSGEDHDRFNGELARSLYQNDGKSHPQAVLAWSATVADAELRETVQGSLFAEWSTVDALAAMRAAVALAPGLDRDNALHTVAEELALRNTAAADAWTQTFTGHDHDIVDAAVQAQTPVGIGATLRRDDAGYPVVSGVMDNMPAALSGLVHPGDRIVGVTGRDGTLIDTGGLDLTQVINLVRGLPNSTLQLQITSAQAGGGYSPPTTVTLLRQRITHS